MSDRGEEKKRRRSLPTATLVGALAVFFGGLAVLASYPISAAAHDGTTHVLGMWNTSVRLTIGLAVSAFVYACGLYRLWGKAGVGQGVARWQAISFAGGWLTVFIALVSPIDALSGELFAVHMVQHLLLILVAAPLIVLGAPLFVGLFALPSAGRKKLAGQFARESVWRSSWDLLSQPLLVWSAFFATLWLWHIPGLYEAALRDQLIHDVQHLAFMASACLTWWILLNPMGRLKLSRGAGVLYLFTTSLHAGALGVLLTLSPDGWYSFYEETTAAWGLTVLQDQQLAGIIMWMPAFFVYIALAAVIFALWLRESETRDRQMERYVQRSKTDENEERRRLLLRRLMGG